MKTPSRQLLYLCSVLFLFCGKQDNWQIYNHKNTGLGTDLIRNIFIENDTVIWVGTYGAGLYRWYNNALSGGVVLKPPASKQYYPVACGRDIYQTWQKVDTPFTAKYLLSIKQDKYRGIWFGTSDNGAFYFRNNQWNHYTAQNGLVDNNVWDILIDTQNAAWLCSRYRGISIINNDSITYMTVKNGLPDNQVTVAAQDSLSRVWIGTARGGLCCYENGGFRYINSHNGLSGNYIRAIICDTTARWVGSWDGGLDYFSDGKWEHIDELVPPVVFLGFDKSNALWAGTWGSGVYMKKSGGWENISTKNSRLPDDHVIDIAFDNNGRVMLATSDGLAIYFPE